MGTVIRAGDCATQEKVIFTAAGVTYLSTSTYFPTTGIAKNQMVRGALISLEGGDIRYHIREPRLTAAANCGMILVSGDYLFLDSPQQIQAFNGINTNAAVSSGVVFYYF